MLAYITWHHPAREVDPAAYEHAIEHFHSSLAHRPPSGFAGSAAFRSAELPWLTTADGGPSEPPGGYEDWYLLDSWSAIGVLEEACVSRGHLRAHDAVAVQVRRLHGRRLPHVRGAAPPRRRPRERMGDARARTRAPIDRGTARGRHGSCDGRIVASLPWPRPGTRVRLLAPEPPAGVAATRLPAGWSATVSSREVLWSR